MMHRHGPRIPDAHRHRFEIDRGLSRWERRQRRWFLVSPSEEEVERAKEDWRKHMARSVGRLQFEPAGRVEPRRRRAGSWFVVAAAVLVVVLGLRAVMG